MVLMANGDEKIDVMLEGSKRIVPPAARDVGRVYPDSPPLENSGSYLDTVSCLNFKEYLLLVIGVNDLKIFTCQFKKFNTEIDLLTTETKPLKLALSTTNLLDMTTRLSKMCVQVTIRTFQS